MEARVRRESSTRLAKLKKAREPEEEWVEEEQAEEEWPEESGPVSGVLLMPLFVGSVEEASDGWMYWFARFWCCLLSVG